MNTQIDATDRALIAALSEDARRPVSALARRLGLARTTVQARIERLERSGAIAGYTLRPGPGLAPAIRATVLVAIEPRSGPAVLTRLRAIARVESAHTTSGRVDMILEISADTTEELDQALDAVAEAKGVRSSESLVHLSTKIARRR